MDEIISDVFPGVRRLDVLETGRRRRWTDDAKQRIVEEAFQRGVSVLTVARRHDVDPSQIYDWRRRLFPQISRGISGFAPVVVTPDCPVPSSRGQMEIVCGNGRRIIVDRDAMSPRCFRVLAGLEG
ncbi:IS66-like element accessory protein TnpA [Sphingobium sp. Ant17]|uniref:IS66-like element accessory protein TnpA n=1 Tax=Sphingobium sp. Ant17 TaxID=1461752 RepID=UPI00044AEA5C|nr:transposase [Sphingobium sp. Ant17]EXS68359.1 transposase [Sphingobium sp. Ant17]